MLDNELLLNKLIRVTERIPLVSRLFKTQEKGHLFIQFGDLDERQESFLAKVIENAGHLPLSSIDREIEDWHYRKYLHIPLTELAIRPFWRDGNSAPPMSFDTRNLWRSHHF